jgi:dihydroorotase
VVMEHVTTKQAIEFVESQGPNVAATITAHHLRITRSDIFKGGICPHLYCLPICKTENDRIALVKAATSGNPKFFAGTDSAPHPIIHKEKYRGYAGIYTAHAAVEIYAMTFAECGCLSLLENFLSGYGADFYGLKRNEGCRLLHLEESRRIPKTFDFPMDSGMEKLSPFLNGETLPFTFYGEGSEISDVNLKNRL